MSEVLGVLVQITVFGLMLVVGLDCTLASLRLQVRRLGLVSTVTLSQFTLVPLIAVLVCVMLDLRGELAAAVVLLCCCPAATISNAYTFLSRGNTPLSVALTTLSCLLAIACTPVALWAFGGLLDLQDGVLGVPAGPLLEQLALLMALPIVLGLYVRHRFPDAVVRSERWLRGASIGLVLALVVMTMLSVPGATLLEEFRVVLVPALVLTALLLPVGLAIAWAFRLDAADRRALTFEFPCQNLAVVALVGLGVLGRPRLLLFAVVYFVVQATILLGLALALGRGPAERGSVSGDGGRSA